MYIKKTDLEMYNDSIERAENNILYMYDYDSKHVLVVNSETKGEYLVTVDYDYKIVIDCECPHFIYRLYKRNIPCKHMIFVANKLNFDIQIQ